MTDTITGGDLYHLWKVSEVHLPRIADAYYDANRLISGAPTDPLGLVWAELRDELQRMYEQVGTTILIAAEGIRQATRDFAEADQANAHELARYLANPINHDPNETLSNPPAPNAHDHPGQPVLPRER